jgi:hypothetical protein
MRGDHPVKVITLPSSAWPGIGTSQNPANFALFDTVLCLGAGRPVDGAWRQSTSTG